MRRFVVTRLRPVLAPIVPGLLLAGCVSTEPSGATPFQRVNPAWVTGQAADRLGTDGRFDFPDPLPPEVGEVSLAEARELAAAFVRHITKAVGNLRQALEEEHGAPIDFAHLAPCGRRAIPVHTNFVESGSVPPYWISASYGPYYLFDFCTVHGVAAVQIWIYDRTQVHVGPEGRLVFPRESGNDFNATGIQLSPRADLSPEFGAKLVFARLAVRITEGPEADGCLVVSPLCYPLRGRHWRFRLERPIRVHLPGGATLETDVVYTQAGFGALDRMQVYVASPTQPPPTWHLYTTSPADTPPAALDSVLLTTVRPIRLEPFELIQ